MIVGSGRVGIERTILNKTCGLYASQILTVADRNLFTPKLGNFRTSIPVLELRS